MAITDLPKKLANPLDAVGLNFNKHDTDRDSFMLRGALAKQGFDVWRHCFHGVSETTGKERCFILDFGGINPQLREDDPVFAKDGTRPSYFAIMAAVCGEEGSVLTRYFPWDRVSTGTEMDVLVSAEDCFLSETRTMGRIEVSAEQVTEDPEEYPEAGKLIWDLKIKKNIALNLGYSTSGPLRDTEIMDAFWHTEGLVSEYDGMIEWNGERYTVKPETSYGYADKVWGKNAGPRWEYISCSDLTSKKNGKLNNSAFSFGVGTQIKVGPIDTQEALAGGIYLDGETYEYNFSKMWMLTRSQTAEKRNGKKCVFMIAEETPLSRMKLKVVCERSQMRELNLSSTAGNRRRMLVGGDGKAELVIERKKVSLKNKWEWETIDVLKGGHVYVSFMDSKSYKK
jgi:tocopherol cyclase